MVFDHLSKAESNVLSLSKDKHKNRTACTRGGSYVYKTTFPKVFSSVEYMS